MSISSEIINTRALKPEILKQNNLVECSFKELKTWNEIHHDLLNEIIAVYQQNQSDGNGLFEEEFKTTIRVRRRTLEKNTNMKRISDNDMFELLKKMRDTSFTLKNIYEKNGYKATKAIAFFDEVTLCTKNGAESYFEIKYSELFASLCHKDYFLRYGNYCTLNLLNTTKLRTKYGKNLHTSLVNNALEMAIKRRNPTMFIYYLFRAKSIIRFKNLNCCINIC